MDQLQSVETAETDTNDNYNHQHRLQLTIIMIKHNIYHKQNTNSKYINNIINNNDNMMQ